MKCIFKCLGYAGSQFYGRNESVELYKRLLNFMIKERIPYIVKSIPETKIFTIFLSKYCRTVGFWYIC